MKDQFKTPEVEVINFNVEDVVTLSATEGSGDSNSFDNMFNGNN